ncbi:MAG: hypothetical protein CSA84_06695 [Actinomycetales bacterium]|nr:MAG: hypothetical protein CSA84_06695 [Actinomycetales bacterium]
MLLDPALVHWLATGDPSGRAFPDLPTPHARLTAYQELVHQRTTALLGPTGRLQFPWPRRLGTPPWGVCRELESVVDLRSEVIGPPGAVGSGTRYRSVLVRHLGPQRFIGLLEQLAAHLGESRPGVLYVGNAWLPRHVTLLVPGSQRRGTLLVYDPGQGRVDRLDTAGLAHDRGRVGGWTHPWFLIGPVGHVESELGRQRDRM